MANRKEIATVDPNGRPACNICGATLKTTEFPFLYSCPYCNIIINTYEIGPQKGGRFIVGTITSIVKDIRPSTQESRQEVYTVVCKIRPWLSPQKSKEQQSFTQKLHLGAVLLEQDGERPYL